MTEFQWTSKKTEAVILDAQGHTAREVAARVGVAQRTIERWRSDTTYMEERDRLSLMVGIAGRAERLRIAHRLIRQRVSAEGVVLTDKDILDWLKFAQSETDGIKLDLAALTAL